MLKWDDAYNIGQQQVDDEHRELFRMLDRISSSISSGSESEDALETALDDLLAYAKQHFADDEEAIMDQAGIDKRHRTHQKMEHTSFFYDIKRLQEVSVDSTVEARYKKLLHFATNWLFFHTLRTDQKLGAQLRELAAGNSPEQAYQAAEDMHFDANIYRPLIDALVNLWSGAMETIHEMEKKAKEA